MLRRTFLSGGPGILLASMASRSGDPASTGVPRDDDADYLTALLSSANDVHIPAGDYHITRPIIVSSRTGLSIEGHNATITQMVAGNPSLMFSACQNLNIKGLRLNGKGSEHSGAAHRFNGVAGILLEGCEHVHVSGCVIRNHAGGGIRWTKSLINAVFDENTIVGIGRAGGIRPGDNNGDFGIGSWAITGPCRGVKIARNTISGHCFGVGGTDIVNGTIEENNIFDIPGQHGIYLAACSFTKVSGNRINGISRIGVKNQISHSTTRTIVAYEVSDNLIEDCETGIFVGVITDLTGLSSADAVVRDNRVFRMREYGIAGRQVSGHIFRNAVIETDAFGIFMEQYAGAISNIDIKRAGWAGLYLSASGGVELSKLTFVQCASRPGLNSSDLRWQEPIYIGRATMGRGGPIRVKMSDCSVDGTVITKRNMKLNARIGDNVRISF